MAGIGIGTSDAYLTAGACRARYYYDTDYKGSTSAHENRPPYYAVYIWRRSS